MPHKFNADRRDKIPKQTHRVTNWAEYNCPKLTTLIFRLGSFLADLRERFGDFGCGDDFEDQARA